MESNCSRKLYNYRHRNLPRRSYLRNGANGVHWETVTRKDTGREKTGTMILSSRGGKALNDHCSSSERDEGGEYLNRSSYPVFEALKNPFIQSEIIDCR